MNWSIDQDANDAAIAAGTHSQCDWCGGTGLRPIDLDCGCCSDWTSCDDCGGAGIVPA